MYGFYDIALCKYYNIDTVDRLGLR